MHNQADSALGEAGNEIGSEEFEEYLSVVGTHRQARMHVPRSRHMPITGRSLRSIDREEMSAANGAQMRCN
jgi:hypothetical protein